LVEARTTDERPSEVSPFVASFTLPTINSYASACKKYSKKAIENMHQVLFKDMYVNAITFEFHLTPDRRLSLMWYVVQISVL